MFLSFIVPVYNVGRFLLECLDSLLQQDIPRDEYEIICVNDGSTDECPTILRHYATIHDHLVVIDQQNSGVCAARNAGLSRAQGDYIWFIDADDCIQPNCLSVLHEKLLVSDADRLVMDNYSFPESENPYSYREKRTNTVWYDSVVWKSVFRRAFLMTHDLHFQYPELIYGEDALFMYEVKYAKPSTVFIDLPFYYCRERIGSASREKTDAAEQRRFRSTIREAEIMKRYYENGRTDQITVDRLMSYLYGALFHIAAMPQKDARQEIKNLRNAGLFPFKRPKVCSIQKSYYVNRGGTVEKLHDFIYCRITVPSGYYAMRCWNKVFQLKYKLLHGMAKQ